jgi:hypothetical protein
MNGRLAIVDDPVQNKALFSAIGSPWGYGSGLWLGCSDAGKEGTWVCDGRPLGFTNWSPGQPDNELAVDDCAEWLADKGEWNDSSCDKHLGFLCRGDAGLRCTGRRVVAGRTTFCAHKDELLDWDGATKSCTASGGKLAWFGSAEESRAVFESLRLPSAIPSSQPLEGVWIGLTDAKKEGSFAWINDAALHFANWASGQPSDSGSGEDCATLTLGDGTWNDADCSVPLPYLCEAK